MLIRSLDLIRFGPYQDRALDFSASGKSFHVVHGSNEAGKSTTLRALLAALFGISRNDPDAHTFSLASLRVGVSLQRGNDSPLTFQRRYGNKNSTIRDAEDRSMPDDTVAPYLCGLTREDFACMYGLDHAKLREGGEALAAGEEKAGQSLFVASTGLTHLSALLGQLKAEAQALYGDRANSAGSLNREKRDYVGCIEDLKRASIMPEEWQRIASELQDNQNKEAELREDLSKASAKLARLEKIRAARPGISQLKDLRVQRESLGPDVPRLPAEAKAQRIEAEQTQRQALDEAREATRKIDQLKGQLEDIPVDRGFRAEQGAIVGLYSRLEQYRNGLDEIERLQVRLEQEGKAGASLLASLGEGTTAADAQRMRLPVDREADFKALREEGIELKATLKAAQEALARATEDLEDSKNALNLAPEPSAFSSLAAAIDFLGEQGPLEQELEALNEADDLGLQKATEILGRLGLTGRDAKLVVELPAPTQDVVRDFAAREEAFDRRERENKELLARTQEAIQRLDDELDDLRQGGSVPDRSDLSEARQDRTRGWSAVREAWAAGDPPDRPSPRFVPQVPLAEAFERSVQRADDIADALFNESMRVQALESKRRERDRQERAAHKTRSELEDISQKRSDLLAHWAAAWSAFAIHPLPPAQIAAWLALLDTLRKEVDDARSRRQKLDRIERGVAEARQRLAAGFADARLLGPGPAESLKEASNRAKQELASHQREAQERKELESAVKTRQRDLDKARDKHSNWQTRWAPLATALGLQADASIQAAEAKVATLARFFETTEEVARLEQTLEENQKACRQIEGQAGALAAILAPELAGLDADRQIEQLYLELSTATQCFERAEGIRKQIADQEEARERWKETGRKALVTLEGLVQQANCADPEELPAAEARSQTLADILQRVESTEDILTQSWPGATLEEIEEACRSYRDLDDLEAQIAKAEAARSELDTELETVRTQKGELSEKIRQLEQKADLPDVGEATSKAQSCLARMRELSGRYVRLTLAQTLLEQGIDSYRESHQSELLAMASEVFACLTDGSFKGVGVSIADNKETLVCLRSGDREVRISGLSDGTRDQLFLAMRIAAVRLQARNSEPVPLILDDVLINFSDNRSRKALRALSDLARHTQVLYFTHHAHVVDLAREEVPAEILDLHDLDGMQAALALA